MDRTRLKEIGIEDELLSLLVMAYMYGAEEVLIASTGEENEPTDIYTEDGNKLAEIVDYSKLEKTIDQPIDGKTARERIYEYTESGDVEALIKVADTESHRVYNAGSYDAATSLGLSTKTWVTMNDDRVRDSHDYLEGVTVPIDAEFYTYNGHHTYYPGQFGVPDEDINCRCILWYGKEKENG